MTDTTWTRRMDDLIEAERDALLSGDLDRIVQLLEEKRTLAQGLADGHVAAETVGRHRTALQRNQELFDRTLEGVRAVAARMAELAQTRATLETYDASGQRRTIRRADRPKIERRA